VDETSRRSNPPCGFFLLPREAARWMLGKRQEKVYQKSQKTTKENLIWTQIFKKDLHGSCQTGTNVDNEGPKFFQR
jgi:hypothetical protein